MVILIRSLSQAALIGHWRFDMNINQNKRKIGARWSVLDRITPERGSERLGGRPSVLSNQRVLRRSRKLSDGRLETVRADRMQVAKEMTRRRFGASSHPFGVRLLEGGVFLAAGISLIVKNGIGHIAGWIRDGREMVSGSDAALGYAWAGEENEEGIWDGDDGKENSQYATESGWGSDHPESNASDSLVAGSDLYNKEPDLGFSLVPEASLREEVEIKKVNRLDAEEDGLPAEELDDQAGALRAMFSDSVRHP